MTITILKSGGTKLEASEVLMLVTVGRRTSRFSYSNFMGMGFRDSLLGDFQKKLFNDWCDCL